MADEPINEPDKTIEVPESSGDQTIVTSSSSSDDTLPVEAPVLSTFAGYDIIDEIARGGVGVVYKVRQKGLDRVVALKILQGAMRASSEQVQRFMHEARSAAKLQHPNIVPIHDFGEQEGEYYFTMDYVEGQSLAEVLLAGPMQPRDALKMVREVADALHYAHEHGVVHRDIKPGNILLDKDGRVKVTDFGLAKEVESEELNLTMTGQVMGTPRYMSPEQASGKTAQADARSDIFSLGVTLYEMLTGQPAFGGESVIEMIQKVLLEDPTPPHKVNRRVHRDVETICMKSIEKVPDRRYATSKDFGDDIERFLAGEPIEAKPVGMVGRSLRRARKHSKAMVIYAVVLFITINAIIFALRARPSHLELKVDTVGATVKLDGVPLTLREIATGRELEPGEHQLRVEAEPLYDPEETTFTTGPGESRSFSFRLSRREGTVAVRTEPPDAGVTLVGEDGFRATFQGPQITQVLPTGVYSLLVHKENYLARGADFEVATRQTNDFQFALLSINLWAAATSGNVLSVPVVDDFDGDGTRDAVVGDDDGNIYCFSGRNGIAIWVFHAEDAVQAPVSKADFDGDGRADVVVGGTDNKLYCLQGRTGQPLWTFPLAGKVLGPSLLRDLTGDGVPDVVVGADDGSVHAVSGQGGQALWSFSTGGAVNSCLAWIDDQGEAALLVGSADRQLYCLNPVNGQLRWRVKVGQPLEFPPRLQPNDQDPADTLVLLPTPTSPGDARTHTPVSIKTRKVLPASDTFPRWLDLDGDGAPEKLVAHAAGTTCYASDGTTERWSTRYVAVGIHAAEVTGDGVTDLIFNNGPEQIICLSGADGEPVGRITLEATVGRGYSLEDVDRDGVPDVVLGAGRRLYCFSWVGGRKRWITQADTYHDVPLVEEGGKVFAKTIGGVISAFDPARPEPVWQVSTSSQPAPYSGLDAGAGIVVDTDAHERRLQVLDARDGKVKWSARLPGEADAAIGTPTIVGDTVLVGDGVSGLHCFSSGSGELRWQQGLTKIVGQAVASQDAIFIADDVNALYCLERETGQVRWMYPVSDPFPSPPLLVDINQDGTEDAVALCDNGFIYALDGRKGSVLWEMRFASIRMRTRHRIVPADIDGDGFVEGIVCSLKGNLVCLDLRKGKPKWIHPLRERVLSQPVLGDVDADGVLDVLVGTLGRRLRCVSVARKTELWSYELGAQVRYSIPAFVPPLQEGAVPLVVAGTGPPENGVYCLSAGAPQGAGADWTGPWKTLTELSR